MEQTIKCKMMPNGRQIKALEQTAKMFSQACCLVLQCAVKNKETNGIKLHYLCYHEIRQKTKLTANLVVRAIHRAAWAINAAKAKGRIVKGFKDRSIDYDQRIFQWKERDEQVSLATIDGRFRISLALGNYQRKALAGKNPSCAKVVKVNKQWFIHINITNEPGKRIPSIGAIGVDRGIYNIAVTSTGKFFGGRKNMHQRKKALALKSRLQRKGTRAAKRHLQLLSGKEARRVRDLNHCVSKQLVQEAKNNQSALVLENLKGIRNNRTNKTSRALIGRWPFRQLGQFVKYKAELAGVKVIEVPAKGTSHECPRCGETKQVVRAGPRFKCTTCGYRAAADFAAASTIARRGSIALGLAKAAVNQPIVTRNLEHPSSLVTSLAL